MEELNKIIGIGVLVLVIGAGIVYKVTNSSSNTVVLKGYIGDKANFLENEKIKKILNSKYNISIDYTKAGSLEMVKSLPLDNIDFLWPSSQVALELFKTYNKGKIIKSEIILNSPIVLFSWEPVTEALISQEIVTKKNNSYYVTDFPKLIQYVTEGKKWSDIGLKEIYGKVSVSSADPAKTNSGSMYAGLLANVLNKGEIVEESSLPEVIPKVRDYFLKLGYMENLASNLFEQYLKTGMGAKPIIVGYENQIIEFSVENKDFWPKVKEKTRILYPIPTVWSSHPLIVINQKATILITALQDKEIQEIAWKEHGFRTGFIGMQNDPKILEVVSIPENIEQVISMPSPQVMEKLIQAIRNDGK